MENTAGGTLLVSLDFELFWGMLDKTTLADYAPHVLGGRAAIPRLLDVFEKYGIHATWATVGFMFAENKAEMQAYFPAPENRPQYENKALNPYDYMDNVGESETDAPCFYAPSLIRLVASRTGQEIGSHTFAHYYCRESGQTPAQFRADMQAARAIGEKHGYALRSVILPRNQCTDECTQVLTDLGYAAYRDEENDWIHEKVKFRPLMRLLRLADVYIPLTGKGGYVPQKENGMSNLIGSRMYKPICRPLKFLEGLKVHRIKAQMKHAAQHNLTFHLWWHPHNIGVRTDEHLKQLEDIFAYYKQLKEEYGMRSLNMGEAAAEMNG